MMPRERPPLFAVSSVPEAVGLEEEESEAFANITLKAKEASTVWDSRIGDKNNLRGHSITTLCGVSGSSTLEVWEAE
jgi:hypothetical protein